MPTVKEDIVNHLEGLITNDAYILKWFPMAKSGDESPEIVHQLAWALEELVDDWVWNNVHQDHWSRLNNEVP